MASTTADRLQRRINDVARAAEAQHEVAAERVRHLAAQARRDALAAAEERQAAFEAELDASVARLSTAIETDFSGEGSS